MTCDMSDHTYQQIQSLMLFPTTYLLLSTILSCQTTYDLVSCSPSASVLLILYYLISAISSYAHYCTAATKSRVPPQTIIVLTLYTAARILAGTNLPYNIPWPFQILPSLSTFARHPYKRK